MEDIPSRSLKVVPVDAEYSDLPPFIPRIETRQIFEELIREEIRNGRMSPSRRRRIVRYAAQIGLSAVETGRMVETCRDEILQRGDPVERLHALRIACNPPSNKEHVIKLLAMLLAALIVHFLVMRWIW